MSVVETNIVDLVSTAPSGEAHLTVSDHLEWDKENKHLLILQEKINSYLRFVESGEMVRRFPDTKGRQILIEVVCMHQPIGDSLVFLDRCEKTIEAAGFQFRWSVLTAPATA